MCIHVHHGKIIDGQLNKYYRLREGESMGVIVAVLKGFGLSLVKKLVSVVTASASDEFAEFVIREGGKKLVASTKNTTDDVLFNKLWESYEKSKINK